MKFSITHNRIKISCKIYRGNIHKPGSGNSTGTFFKTSTKTTTFNFWRFKFSIPITTQRYSGTSEGCFLIDITKWNEFMSHFPAGTGKIGIINK
jgi:hypothetical protein